MKYNLFFALLTFEGILAFSHGDFVIGPGPDQISKALDFEHTLRALGDHGRGHHSEISMSTTPMVQVSSPIHHRRRRIHRRPITNVRFMKLRNRDPIIPKAFFEAMKIRERIVVDDQNRPKSVEMSIVNDLMQLDPHSGGFKMLRHGEMHIKPKHALITPDMTDIRIDKIKSVGERRFLINEFNINDASFDSASKERRIDRFIRYFHLNKFWPLFFFSAICGFSFVGLTFLAAKLILALIDDNEGFSYDAVPTDESLLESIESAQPIKITDDMIEINENSSLTPKNK